MNNSTMAAFRVQFWLRIAHERSEPAVQRRPWISQALPWLLANCMPSKWRPTRACSETSQPRHQEKENETQAG
ncbi:rCG20923 [Rattus norvegicus]|uniref:RCG20923 n=1 Tax=Rattus norvegicus TaxID=10116 RepID=A6JEE4_RAT|nr:rCG20923 [Rattus norvegicus]